MTFRVFNEDVDFTEKEYNALKEGGFDIDGGYLELMLHWNNIETLSFLSMDEKRKACIDALKAYDELNLKTLSIMEKEGLI